MSDKVHQIDIVKNPAKEMGFKTEYTFVLKDKWKSTIDTEQEQADYDNITKFLLRYQKNGRENALKYLAQNHDKIVDETWKSIFDQASHLKTFKHIGKCKELFFPE
jgi:hypothetical protein